MVINAAIKELINSCSPVDEIVSCEQEDYYNNGGRIPTKEVVDIVKENGKLIILTR